MASAKKKEFNAWEQMLGMQGNNMIPMSSAELVQQSTPLPIGGMSMPPEEPVAPPPPPRPEPVPPQAVRTTAQPTRQPMGTVPQEIVPQAMGPGPVKKLSLAEEIDLSTKNYGQGLAMNQAEVDKLKENLAAYSQQSQGVDFTPLAALVDSWTGSKLTEAAKATAPESASQKLRNMADMQGKIAAAQGQLSSAELAGLQQRLAQLGYQEQRKTALDIARINADARKSGIVQEKLLQRKAERMDADVQKLEKRVGDIVPGVITKMELLEQLVPGGIEGDEQGDVPGVGVGAFLVPDFMMGEDASDIQQNARGLAADLIKLQSGTAASDKEVDRKMKELGMAPGSKSSTFRSGLKRLKLQIGNELKNKEAGFKPEVVEAYRGRGGITHERIRDVSKPKAEDDLGADLESMTPEQLQEWLSKHGGQ